MTIKNVLAIEKWGQFVSTGRFCPLFPLPIQASRGVGPNNVVLGQYIRGPARAPRGHNGGGGAVGRGDCVPQFEVPTEFECVRVLPLTNVFADRPSPSSVPWDPKVVPCK